MSGAKNPEALVEPVRTHTHDEGSFPETVIHAHLDGAMRKYIPVDGEELKRMLRKARAEAFEEVADTFSELTWQCLDHGGEEVARVRSMVFALRDKE
jgi:hypothetical protein